MRTLLNHAFMIDVDVNLDGWLQHVCEYSELCDRDSPDCIRRLPLVEFEVEEEEEEWKEGADSEEISKRLDNVYCVMRDRYSTFNAYRTQAYYDCTASNYVEIFKMSLEQDEQER